MSRSRLMAALVFMNLGVFVCTAAFLPRSSSFGWTTGNPLSYAINSRAEWDIAWLVAAGTSLASVGVYLVMTGRNSDEAAE